MIEIFKNTKIIATLFFDFESGTYSIEYNEPDEDIEVWYSLYKNEQYFNIKCGCMTPYDIESGILSHKASLEYNGYEFKLINTNQH